MDNMSLVVKVSGEVLDTNFEEYKKEVLRAIGEINLEPKTDQEFAEAKETVKKLKEAEKAIDAAREAALESTVDVNALFKSMTEVADKLSKTRSALHKAVTAEEAKRKEEIIKKAVVDAHQLIKGHEPTRAISLLVPVRRSDFEEAIKGKRTPETRQKAIDAVYNQYKERVKAAKELIAENVATIDAEENQSLFLDRNELVIKQPGELHAIIEERKAKHALAEREKAEQAEEMVVTSETVPEVGGTRTESFLPGDGKPADPPSPEKEKSIESTAQTTWNGAKYQPLPTEEKQPVDTYIVTVSLKGNLDNARLVAKEIKDFVMSTPIAITERSCKLNKSRW